MRELKNDDKNKQMISKTMTSNLQSPKFCIISSLKLSGFEGVYYLILFLPEKWHPFETCSAYLFYFFLSDVRKSFNDRINSTVSNLYLITLSYY